MAATATATKTETPTVELPKEAPALKPLHPSAIAKQSEGQHWREWLIRLPQGMSARDLVERSDLWNVLQGDRSTAVSKLDRVSILDYEESVLCEAVVSSASDRAVVLAKPRFTELTSRLVESQLEDELHRVAWVGTGYCVVRKRDNQRMSHITVSRMQAERDLIGLRPRPV